MCGILVLLFARPPPSVITSLKKYTFDIHASASKVEAMFFPSMQCGVASAPPIRARRPQARTAAGEGGSRYWRQCDTSHASNGGHSGCLGRLEVGRVLRPDRKALGLFSSLL